MYMYIMYTFPQSVLCIEVCTHLQSANLVCIQFLKYVCTHCKWMAKSMHALNVSKVVKH